MIKDFGATILIIVVFALLFGGFLVTQDYPCDPKVQSCIPQDGQK